jgi:hypothetical protein
LAKKPTEARRKLIEFDAQTWHALNLLSRESKKTFQELADEAFRDLLQKYRRAPIWRRRCGKARALNMPALDLKRETIEALVRELHGQRQSLRQISKTLAAQGHLTGGGRSYTATAVQKMLRGG